MPVTDLTRGHVTPAGVDDSRAVIGVWTAAYRRKAVIRQGAEPDVEPGPWVQVSLLGNPLFNEVIVQMSDKDRWNALPPSADAEFARSTSAPLADPEVRTHTAVHRRTVGGRICGAGVYPALTEGHYRVHGDRPDLPTEVGIRGGEVTQLDWR